MKKLKRLLLILCVFLLSGCIKNKTTMTINSDKSINYLNDLLIKSEYAEELTQSIDSEDYSDKGFSITTLNENGYSGYRISKKFKSIDEMSNNNGEVVIISNIASDDFDITKVFKRKKGFFKDTYTANFKYIVDSNSFDNSNNLFNDVETEENDNKEDLIFNEGHSIDSDETDMSDLGSDLSDLSSFMGDMEFSFTVNLPSKAINHNSTDVSNNDKTLKWQLSQNEDTNISFSFNLINIKSLLIIGSAVIACASAIILIFFFKKKSRIKNTLIHKEYDPSIAKEIGIKIETKNNIDNHINQNPSNEFFMPQQVNNLEFAVSEEEMQKHKEQEQKKKLEIEQNLASVQKEAVSTPSVNYNVRPDFVRDNDKKTFLQNEEVVKPKAVPEVSTIKIDVPDAIEFSDIDKK